MRACSPSKNDIVKWTNEKGKDFLEQWAGANLAFPLTDSQIDDLNNICSIFCENEFVGIIQKIRKEMNNIHIGRFLINPELAGKGFGKRACTKNGQRYVSACKKHLKCGNSK